MIKFAVINQIGRITRVGYCLEEDLKKQKLGLDEIILEIPDNVTEDYYYNKTANSFLFPGQPPSQYHHFDLLTNSWAISQEGLDLLKTKLFSDISIFRGRLALQPIQYDNKTLDADIQAQSNINGKIQEIFAREAINYPLTSAEMFWKDADNVIHSWNNQNDYKLWLQGLVIAISSRNTSLYATAWQKKAEVEALTDINDILNYDVNTGW